MGKVVAAFGQSHIVCDDKGIEEQAQRVFDGFKYIGDKIKAAKPDVLVLISDDHMCNINTQIQVPIAVAVGDKHIPLGDMDIPTDPITGHREFAEGFVRYANSNGFDLAKLEEEYFRPDHGVTVPLMFNNTDGSIPTVIINTNINMDPAPSIKRCWDLGTLLKKYIETERPDAETVAVVGAGGISHWLMIEHHGEINEEWDEAFLKMFEDGTVKSLITKTNEEILEVSGNGGTEIMNWFMMLATVPDAKGKKVFYEPVYPWMTGMGGVEMLLD